MSKIENFYLTPIFVVMPLLGSGTRGYHWCNDRQQFWLPHTVRIPPLILLALIAFSFCHCSIKITLLYWLTWWTIVTIKNTPKACGEEKVYMAGMMLHVAWSQSTTEGSQDILKARAWSRNQQRRMLVIGLFFTSPHLAYTILGDKESKSNHSRLRSRS